MYLFSISIHSSRKLYIQYLYVIGFTKIPFSIFAICLIIRRYTQNWRTYSYFTFGSICRNASTDDKLWHPFNENEVNYLHITSTLDEMRKGLLMDRLSFWRTILSKSHDVPQDKKSKDELWEIYFFSSLKILIGTYRTYIIVVVDIFINC